MLLDIKSIPMYKNIVETLFGILNKNNIIILLYCSYIFFKHLFELF